MTLPGDNQQANEDAKVDGSTHPEYEMLGHFEPRDAERILKELEEQHISFEVKDCSYRKIGLFTIWPSRRSWLCIYVSPEQKQKAEAVRDQDSAQSRATAGIRYVAAGSIICAAALLLMRSGRSGVSSIPSGHSRGPIPLELVAGIAGIVVFMGVLQLLIVFILKMRERRRSHLVQAHLTNR
jgi:hypothetical protein